MRRIMFLISLATSLSIASASYAICVKDPWNPVTQTAFNALTPLRVGGVAVVQNKDLPDANEAATTLPGCTCTTSTETYMGVKISVWQLDTMAEIVGDAYCSPTLGTKFGGLDNGFHGGTNQQHLKHIPRTTKQVHWAKFPLFAILGILSDSKCFEVGNGFDFMYFSEMDPLHNEPTAMAIVDPKVFLFASPVFDLACAASRVISLVPGSVLTPAFNSLYWCCFDNIYSLTGDKSSQDELESSAAFVAKQIYKNTQYMLHPEYTTNACKPTYRPWWKKDNFRFALAKPVTMSRAIICDRPSITWGWNLNPPYREGNFLWHIFQKRLCCQKIKGAN